MNDAAANPPSASPAEVELFRKHPAMFRNHPGGFLLTTLLLIGGIVGAFMFPPWPLIASVIALIIFAQWWLKCKSTTLIVTNEGVNVEHGILSKATNELWHSDVRNVQIVQSFTQRIMGVGTVNISSSGQSGIEISVGGISNPQEVHKIIEEQRRRLGNI